jgi:hypothetical protein
MSTNETKEYRYFTVLVDARGQGNLEALNKMIQEGWRPVRESPMGAGASVSFGALVLLER